ncbi:Peptidyl-prolyl cis-trans isomerase CWC27 like protein [Eufriesea mexicana]|uniref:Spliceosome-associated protein CWC27 homolog n=1 Tax=Eufriesea mexicana TaxID=516756 RepID=A0A310S923_9HYME|nr:Peptidyl-prolyl cis-trans isomerase CWC27 like protein [Eufriesea mexicana]
MSNQETREAACVSKDKDVWHRQANMMIFEEVENEHLAIVMKGKDEMTMECEYCSMINNAGAEVYKEKREVLLKTLRRGNTYHVALRNRKRLTYVSTEKDVSHRHANMRIIEEMENVHLVIMKTTVGDIELELWAEGTPKACRNFIQLCMESYSDDTIFHRIIQRFMVVMSKDEFRTRIHSCGRGLIAVATAGKDDNTSQFLFTPSSTSELQSKHIIFDKVTGKTMYSMLKLEKAPVDENDRPLYPARLLKSIILNNPFSVIMSRIIVQKSEEVKDSSKTKTAVVKDFNVLSFGEEAEEDIEEIVILNKKFSGKGKSAHDHNDGVDAYKENREARMKEVRRGNACYAESRKRKEAAYVSTEKNVWHRHGNMGFIEEMENEQVNEFHTRLRFCRRNLIAMANAEKDDNGSQFFFTLRFTPELQSKHTIFGKATGGTIYNTLKLEEALINENDRPLYPSRLIKTIISNKSFSDIMPKIIVQECEEVKDSSKTKTAAVKDFNLLSFGEEAEEDIEEIVILNKKFSGKGKSAHDHVTNPK